MRVRQDFVPEDYYTPEIVEILNNGFTKKESAKMSPKKKTFEPKLPRRTETITVQGLNSQSFGILSYEGKWYNVSKFKKEVFNSIQKDHTYELTISTSTASSGKTYDNVIAATEVEGGEKQEETLPTTTPSKEMLTTSNKVYQPAKGRDYDKEARGKSRCMLFAAALQCPRLAGQTQWSTTKELIQAAIELADGGMEYTFQEELEKLEAAKPSATPEANGVDVSEFVDC